MHNTRTLKLAHLNVFQSYIMLLIACAFLALTSQNVCCENGLLDTEEGIMETSVHFSPLDRSQEMFSCKLYLYYLFSLTISLEKFQMVWFWCCTKAFVSSEKTEILNMFSMTCFDDFIKAYYITELGPTRGHNIILQTSVSYRTTRTEA